MHVAWFPVQRGGAKECLYIHVHVHAHIFWNTLSLTIISMWLYDVTIGNLVPRPSLTAFFAAVKKKRGEKSCEGRLGYEVTQIVA